MPFEVFISYSHRDRELLNELTNHLANLRRQQLISSWYDGDITPGTEWQPQIMDHLNTAQILLLLISSDFIASDFCYSTEMTRAIIRHNTNEARVIPIILRPVDWQDAPFFKLQVLPTGGKPVTDWPTLDHAFEDIAKGIRAAIDDLIKQGTTPTSQAKLPLSNIPYARNPLFTGREDILTRLSTALHSGKTTALTQAISGLGGIGKTQTAIEYAYRYQHDYDAIFWVRAESRETLTSDFATLAHLLNLPEQHEQEQQRAIDAVKRWLHDHTHWLLILDNADDLDTLRDFLPSNNQGHTLLTTRSQITGRIAQRIELLMSPQYYNKPLEPK